MSEPASDAVILTARVRSNSFFYATARNDEVSGPNAAAAARRSGQCQG
jgi:hypothetical protein